MLLYYEYNNFIFREIIPFGGKQMNRILAVAKALHGPTLPREFHRQDMESIFKKKIKTRFLILFKRAVEFHLMKARGRI